MMRPVILSSPEKLAFLLTIFCAGGSATTSSPGCNVAGACGTPLGWRCPGGIPGNGLAGGGATAAPRPGCGGGNPEAGGGFLGKSQVAGGGGRGGGCTPPGPGPPRPAAGRVG